MKTKVILYTLLGLLSLAGVFAFKDVTKGGDNPHQTVMIRLKESLDENAEGQFKHIHIIRNDGNIEEISFTNETGPERMKTLLHKFNELAHLGYKLVTSNSTAGRAGDRYVEYVFVK